MSREDSFLTADLNNMFKHTIVVRHPLEEHYRDFEHQSETAVLGMWLFLATEIMFFGTLFLVLGVYRYQYPAAFEAGSETLTWQIGAINTFVLLLSSYTMVLAVHYSKLGDNRRIARYLLLTAFLGVVFIGFKAAEYYIDYVEYLIPGWRFNAQVWVEKEGLSPGQVPHVQLFLGMYWVMTVIHLIHMIIGISIVLFLAWLARRNYFSAEHNTAIDVTGLYWHFVDIVWIFLLPMLYLQGTHTL